MATTPPPLDQRVKIGINRWKEEADGADDGEMWATVRIMKIRKMSIGCPKKDCPMKVKKKCTKK